MCQRADDLAAEMRQVVRRKGYNDQLNRAVGLLNDGKHKDGIAILRDLEQYSGDAEAVAKAREILKQLGKKPVS